MLVWLSNRVYVLILLLFLNRIFFDHGSSENTVMKRIDKEELGEKLGWKKERKKRMGDKKPLITCFLFPFYPVWLKYGQ